MLHGNITAVINACSGDRNFLLENVKSLRGSCSEIIIPYSTHLYNGEPDELDKWLLIKEYLKPYDVKFITFDKVIGSPLGQNTARWTGYCTGIKSEWTLFMDADEIFEKDKFDVWTRTFDVEKYKVIFFSAYFYSMASKYRACLYEEETLDFIGDRNESMSGPNFPVRHALSSAAGLLVRTDLITHDRIFTGPERWKFLQDHSISSDAKIEVTTSDIRTYGTIASLLGERMLHHYAYVRSKDQMKRKISNYAHVNDKDWEHYLSEYFKEDFVFNPKMHREIYGYICEEVTPIHEIFSLEDFDKYANNL